LKGYGFPRDLAQAQDSRRGNRVYNLHEIYMIQITEMNAWDTRQRCDNKNNKN
jgi:hypothetical protein